jgi:hypothetical protein
MDTASTAGLTLPEAISVYSHVGRTPEDRDWIPSEFLNLPVASAAQRDVGYRALSKSADWYLEPLQSLQPRSFEAFYQSGPPEILVLEAVWEDVQMGPLNLWSLFLHVNERMIEITVGDGEEAFLERLRADEWLSLPPEIRRSWLWRVTGWKLPIELTCPLTINRQMIKTFTDGIDELVGETVSSGKEKGLILAHLMARFPDIAPERPGARWNLRCFLDTRPMGVGGRVGDQLFTRMKMRDGVVYRVRNGDVAGLHVLDNPGEAIDCYHEHLLLKRPGEFDFSPWARPLT